MNARIDHSNYEAWLLDRLEGNLTPVQERELDAFLLANPDLVPAEGDLPVLPGAADALSAADKDALKRTLPPEGLPGSAPIDDFLIARWEGDLGADQVKALEAYIARHPQQRRNAMLYERARIAPRDAGTLEKDTLYRQLPPQGLPTRHTLLDFLVARLEGDLTPEQEGALVTWLAGDPEARRTWALLQHTRVRAMPVVYHGKQLLKRHGRVIALDARVRPWAVRLAVAASLALLFGIGVRLLRDEGAEQPRFAEKERHAPAAQRDVRTSDPAQVEEGRTPIDGAGPRTRPHQAAEPEGGSVVPAPARPEERGDAVPLPSEEPMPMLVESPVLPATPDPQKPEPAPSALQDEPLLAEVAPPATQATTAEEGMTVGNLLAATFREKVLDAPGHDAAPLDGDDVVATVDKGLKALGGDRAGLSVEKRGGRISGFDLRLGRNLAITAHR